jgi:hypothetical protein
MMTHSEILNLSDENNKTGYTIYYIAAAVKKPGDEEDGFKFYEALQYFERPPSDERSSAWCYLSCKQLMSLDKKVLYIKWD